MGPIFRHWIVVILIGLALAAPACSDAGGGEQPLDAGVDTRPDDVGADAADAADEVFTSAEVTAGGATVAIGFEPFELEVRDAAGDVLTSAPGGEQISFAGLGVGRVDGFGQGRYYYPTLPRGDGDGAARTWFRPAGVESSTETEAGYRFVVATEDAAGEAGPSLTVTLERGEHSVKLRVVGPSDAPEFVHTSLSLSAADGEGFYGLGELFDRLDARGTSRQMQIQAEGSSESSTNEVHVPIPFCMSTAGYGLYVEDRHPAAFELGSRRDDVMRVTHNSRDVTYHFMAADEPMTLVEAYTDIVGKPAHVPFWALAPQWWRNVNDSQAQFLDDIQRAHDADVPSTMVWIDRPWSSYYHNWRFNLDQFPDPQAMFDEAARLGHRILLHTTPHMNPPGQSDVGDNGSEAEELYSRFEDNEWLVEYKNGSVFTFPWGGGTGAFVDFTHPDAVAEVQRLITRVTDLGAMGTKMDWDEYLQPNLAQAQLPLVFHNGETTQTMKGWYSALFHKTIIEGFDQGAGEPTFHVSRSGAAGGQQWNTCIWPGDLDNDFSPHTRGPSEFQDDWNVGGMPSAIMANQSLGMSGFPCFASDIGGYRDGLPTEEVLLRWVAFGTFNGVMQLGGGGGSHMPWTADATFSRDALDVVRKYFKLRMRLFPYIFQYFRRAEQTGRPLVRSLWLAFPDDAQARAHEDEFMFGPHLLVAPVHTEGATEREVYLPAGDWVDYWSGERVSGPTTLTRAAPLDLIPLYIRQGAVIPMAAEGIDTLLPAADADTVSYQDVDETYVRVFLADEAAELSLFNGLSIAATDGAPAQIEVAVGQPDAAVDARVGFAPQTVVLQVEAAGTAFEDGPGRVDVERGGQSVQLSQGSQCTDCWSFDAQRTLLTVRLAEPGLVTVQ